MPTPYRAKPVIKHMSRDMAWRRTAGGGALWFGILLALQAGLTAASAPTPWTVTCVGTALWIGLSVTAWMATTPTAPRRAGLLSWTLRATAAGAGTLFVVSRYTSTPHWAVLASVLLVDAVALAWAVRGLRQAEIPLRARDPLLLALMVVASVGADGWRFGDLHLVVAAAFQLWLWLLFARLSQTIRVRERQWWFDNETEAPGNWVSLLVRRDGCAEVTGPDEDPRRFSSEQQATAWLEDNSYMPAERALEDGLVNAVPDPAMKARSRKRIRAEQAPTSSQGSRVRVAPDASDHELPEASDATIDQTDELDEDAAVNTVDEAAPRRAATAEDPRNPRD